MGMLPALKVHDPGWLAIEKPPVRGLVVDDRGRIREVRVIAEQFRERVNVPLDLLCVVARRVSCVLYIKKLIEGVFHPENLPDYIRFD